MKRATLPQLKGWRSGAASAALLLAASLIGTPASAAKTIITFDDATANFAASLTYPGVTFTGVTNPPTAVAAANPGLVWATGTNSYIYTSGPGAGPNGTIGIHGFFASIFTGTRWAPVWAELGAAVNSVSVDIGFLTGGSPSFGSLRTLQVFGEDGLQIAATSEVVPAGQAGMRTYTLTAPGIRYAYFGPNGPSGNLWADNFCFGDGCGQRTSPGVVPEPSTWMLMILGFGLIAQQLRRRHLAAAVA